MKIASEFEALLENTDLIKHHSFDNGEDNGLYLNFTFETTKAQDLWSLIKEKFYGDDQIGHAMKKSSMAMCSNENGWDDYVLLFHYDPKIKTDAPRFI